MTRFLAAPSGAFFAASPRSAEFGRAANAALARAPPASLTDGGDAVGTSRASARRTSGPVASARRTSGPVVGFTELSELLELLELLEDGGEESGFDDADDGAAAGASEPGGVG